MKLLNYVILLAIDVVWSYDIKQLENLPLDLDDDSKNKQKAVSNSGKQVVKKSDSEVKKYEPVVGRFVAESTSESGTISSGTKTGADYKGLKSQLALKNEEESPKALDVYKGSEISEVDERPEPLDVSDDYQISELGEAPESTQLVKREGEDCLIGGYSKRNCEFKKAKCTCESGDKKIKFTMKNFNMSSVDYDSPEQGYPALEEELRLPDKIEEPEDQLVLSGKRDPEEPEILYDDKVKPSLPSTGDKADEKALMQPKLPEKLEFPVDDDSEVKDLDLMDYQIHKIPNLPYEDDETASTISDYETASNVSDSDTASTLSDYEDAVSTLSEYEDAASTLSEDDAASTISQYEDAKSTLSDFEDESIPSLPESETQKYPSLKYDASLETLRLPDKIEEPDDQIALINEKDPVESKPSFKSIHSNPAFKALEAKQSFNSIKSNPAFKALEAKESHNSIKSSPAFKALEAKQSLDAIEAKPSLNAIEFGTDAKFKDVGTQTDSSYKDVGTQTDLSFGGVEGDDDKKALSEIPAKIKDIKLVDRDLSDDLEDDKIKEYEYLKIKKLGSDPEGFVEKHIEYPKISYHRGTLDATDMEIKLKAMSGDLKDEPIEGVDDPKLLKKLMKLRRNAHKLSRVEQYRQKLLAKIDKLRTYIASRTGKSGSFEDDGLLSSSESKDLRMTQFDSKDDLEEFHPRSLLQLRGRGNGSSRRSRRKAKKDKKRKKKKAKKNKKKNRRNKKKSLEEKDKKLRLKLEKLKEKERILDEKLTLEEADIKMKEKIARKKRKTARKLDKLKRKQEREIQDVQSELDDVRDSTFEERPSFIQRLKRRNRRHRRSPLNDEDDDDEGLDLDDEDDLEKPSHFVQSPLLEKI